MYINLTNRCSNACAFCVREAGSVYEGANLILSKEPTADEVISELKKRLTDEREVVFCGYGEPTYAHKVMAEAAAWAKKAGLTTRLNTNGQGVLIAGPEIIAELVGRIDTVSISLNAAGAKEYDRLCRSIYGEEAFGAVLDFAKAVKGKVKKVVFSVVDLIGADEIARCQKLADSMGIELKVRKLIV